MAIFRGVFNGPSFSATFFGVPIIPSEVGVSVYKTAALLVIGLGIYESLPSVVSETFGDLAGFISKVFIFSFLTSGSSFLGAVKMDLV